jgi:hypothetical protein
MGTLSFFDEMLLSANIDGAPPGGPWREVQVVERGGEVHLWIGAVNTNLGAHSYSGSRFPKAFRPVLA